MSAALATRAAKAGLASILEAITVDGSPAFASVLSRMPSPSQSESRPRAAIVGAMDYTREPARGEVDQGAGVVAVRVGDVDGTLRILIATHDPSVGEGGAESSAVAVAAAIEQEFYKTAAGGVDVDEDLEGLHGVVATVADYYDAEFLYHIVGIDDPPLELVQNGIAEIVIRVEVTGPVYRLIAAPPIVPILELIVDDVAETIVIDREYDIE